MNSEMLLPTLKVIETKKGLTSVKAWKIKLDEKLPLDPNVPCLSSLKMYQFVMCSFSELLIFTDLMIYFFLKDPYAKGKAH